ncbi:transmembrane protein 65-like isoform X2 [Clavelina lepadiformis]|uniref:transmembrane protein 65-like isoform X2 n=1 Tax=Clavelina lepadiformis TaxID=159417 RepID=UPI0040419B2D
MGSLLLARRFIRKQKELTHGMQGRSGRQSPLTRFYLKDSRSCRQTLLPGQIRSSRFPHPKLCASERVEKFVESLNKTERESLINELQKYKEAGPARSKEVSVEQLRLIFIFNCIPFIGFGFLDNAIMILAGEYIDFTIGAALGISTMAAAAFGNLISDLAGVGLAGYVEVLCGKAGLPAPNLTPEQMELNKTRIVANVGKALGIMIGCLVGMFPLLFIDVKHDQEGE